MCFCVQSSGIRVKLKAAERNGGTEAADAGVLNGRSHGKAPEVVTISDEDDDVIIQVPALRHTILLSTISFLSCLSSQCMHNIVPVPIMLGT